MACEHSMESLASPFSRGLECWKSPWTLRAFGLKIIPKTTKNDQKWSTWGSRWSPRGKKQRELAKTWKSWEFLVHFRPTKPRTLPPRPHKGDPKNVPSGQGTVKIELKRHISRAVASTALAKTKKQEKEGKMLWNWCPKPLQSSPGPRGGNSTKHCACQQKSRKFVRSRLQKEGKRQMKTERSAGTMQG